MFKINKFMRYILLLVLIGVPLKAIAQENTSIKREVLTQLLQTIDTENRIQALPTTTTLQTSITREDMAVMLVNVLGYEGIAKDYKNSTLFKDVITHKGEVATIVQLGIMTRTGTNLFNPQGKVTLSQAETIIQRVQDKLNEKNRWAHAFYAIESSSQMALIPNYNAISFGWAQVNYDEETGKFVLNTSNTRNDFKIPSKFEKPLDLAKANNVETYLMIYFEDQGSQAKKLLNNTQKSETLIKEIIASCNQITKDSETRSFDGVTIDFENFYNSDLKVPYTQFLTKLNKALKADHKKLNVAVQPNTYFKGYDYKAIGEVADKIILMAHDYAPKQLTAFEKEIGAVMTPITPINEVYKTLQAITHPLTGVQDKSKIVLQLSFGSTQWQLKNSKVIHSKPYTPSYDKIYQRLQDTNTTAFYSELYQNPYVTYEQDGISNVIWYENNKSVKAKIELAELLGISSVSYWRLGIIPDFEEIKISEKTIK